MPADSAIPRRVRNSILVAFALLFIGVGWSTVYRAGLGERERTDFTVYHAAGRAVIDGTPLYEAKNVRGWLYMYLPVFAVLMVPLAVLPKTVAAGVFYLLSLAALLQLSPSGLTRRLDGLVRLGVVERRPSELDRRVMLAVLTDHGQAYLEKVAPDHVDSVRRHIIDLISRDDMAAMARIFRTIRTALRGTPPT